MGLDVYALQILGPGDEDCDHFLENHPDFAARGDGIEPGWYKCSKLFPSTGSIRWSYSGYGRWREELARFAHPDLDISEYLASDGNDYDNGYAKTHPYSTAIWNCKLTTGAFVELINFSDCEGFLGPQTCAKLYNDFKTYESSFLDTHDPHVFGEHYLAMTAALKAVVDSPATALLMFG